MAEDDTPGGRGGNVLAGLLAPLRLPERVLEALDELRPMRTELTRVREQTEPLGEVLAVLRHLEDAVGSRLDTLSESLGPVDDRLRTLEREIQRIASEVGAIHETIMGIKDDIQRTTGLRGDRGMMERARDVITGGNQEQDRASAPDRGSDAS